MEAIKTSKDMTNQEFNRLCAAAELIEAETGKVTMVDTIYFDYGQDWWWTTIVMKKGTVFDDGYQLLNPRQQERILFGSLEEWMHTVKELIEEVNRRGW